MKRPNVIRLVKWVFYFLPSLLFIYASSRFFFSAPFKSTEIESRIGKDVWDDRSLSEHIPHIGLPTQIQALQTGARENVQLPPFVDSRDPMLPGQGGAALIIDEKNLSEENRTRYRQGWAHHNFNQYVSDMISIHRSLPDCTYAECKEFVKNFTGTLPQLSVVIIFNNEAWTALLRSVHSVLSRTPEDLLKEIILVDDNSTYDYLRAPLDKYFSSFHKVKIIHSPQKIGLTRARLVGFEASLAPIVVFLDSHIECFPGWAESILIRISNNPNSVIFPHIHNIHDQTFGVKCHDSDPQIGTFEWKNLMFNWMWVPRRERERRKNISDSYRSPVMPGGLFAIGREFFKRLGTYDPSLDFWGGENIELSFKIWMCGGSLELDPCSVVGHVFRKSTPIKGSDLVVYKNSIRVAYVWMDDYRNYFFERNRYNHEEPGNLTDRINLRQSLQCQNFEWYLKNVFPEKTFPSRMKYAGEIRSAAFPKCLDNNNDIDNHPIMYTCLGSGGKNQVWYMGEAAQIQQDDKFVCVADDTIVLSTAECQPPGRQWEYKEDKTMYHIPTGHCLTASADGNRVYSSSCTNSTWQKWNFEERRKDLNFPAYP